MPFKTLKLQPGVDVQESPFLNMLQLTASNLIRFYAGLVQKLGGWQQLTTNLFIGTCRGLHGWADIVGNAYLAVGTEQRLAVLTGGTLYDITPLAATDNPAVAFSTSIGSPSVEILDAGYSPNVGDWINLLTQVSVGGIVVFGYYPVATVIDATHYTITAASPATANVTAGGAVPSYTTANGFATVTVTLDNHGFVVGSIYDAAVPTTVATVLISGLYSVTSPTTNTFVITASTPANANTTASENGGNARIEYLLPNGFAVNTGLTGYGSGLYGGGLYGGSSGGTAIAPLRQWSLDHFGQDLIASPTNGTIYYWQPPTIQPATMVPNAPLKNISVFVMPQIEIIVALGAEIGGTQEPLLVRWCDAGDFTDWTASATNQAGSYQISTGSRLVGGLAVGLGALLWTDTDLWSMTYQGLPFVFGFNRIAAACGLISMRSAGISGTFVMWLSTRGFFTYSLGGGVTPVECSVWDFINNNIDTTQLDQVHCAVNALFNEMAWHFPILSTSPIYSAATPMGYVKVNYVEHLIWDYGISPQYQRTAWVGRSPVGNPVGSDFNGLLQQHEIGYDANGVGMQWSWQTGYFDLAEGEEFVFADLLMPDCTTIGNPTISYTILATPWQGQAPNTYGPYMATTTTDFIPFRARARYLAINASGSDLGTFNRLGALRYRFAQDGRN